MMTLHWPFTWRRSRPKLRGIWVRQGDRWREFVCAPWCNLSRAELRQSIEDALAELIDAEALANAVANGTLSSRDWQYERWNSDRISKE
jgi:hypothetical protein